MSTTVSFNGVSYEVPETGETSWGEAVSNLLIALATFSATSSSQRASVRVATASPVTVASNDYTVVVRRSVAGATTVNLPAGTTGQIFAIVDGAGDAATNNITITPSGSETIGDVANYVINANNGAVLLQYNTTNTRWQVLSDAQGLLTNADIAANAGIAFSKLAPLADGTVLLGSPSNVAASYTVDGDVLIGPGGVTSIRPGVIVDADVNASAAIAASKLANTPSGNLAATTVQGALNELQSDVDTRATVASVTAANAALAAHDADPNGVHGVTGNVVGTTDTQTLTNKTLTAPTINDAAATNLLQQGVEDWAHVATPSNPSPTRLRMYAKSDDKVYIKTSGGVETALLRLGDAGGGDVVGPASSTDNAIARYDGATGKLLQSSGATLSDAGAVSAAYYAGARANDPGSGSNDRAIGDNSVAKFTTNLTLTGLAGGMDGRELTLIAENGVSVSLTNEDAASVAANRIITGTGATFVFTGGSCQLVYDGNSQRWRRVGTAVRNNDVAAGAAIDYSKLNLSGSVVNADVSASAAIAGSKLQAAGTGNAGVVTTAAQSFAGAKTFTGEVTAPYFIGTRSNDPGSGSNDRAIGAALIAKFTTNITLTGFAGGVDGRLLIITTDNANSVAITNDDPASAAANRVITGTGATLTLAGHGAAILFYDGNTARWRVISAQL